MELGRLGLAWGRSDLKSGRNLSAVENSWPVKADLTCCLRSPSQSRSFALTRRPANHLSVLLSLYQPRPQTAIEKYRQQLRNCRADFSSFSLRSLSGKHGGGGWELCCLSALLVILRCQSTKAPLVSCVSSSILVHGPIFLEQREAERPEYILEISH